MKRIFSAALAAFALLHLSLGAALAAVLTVSDVVDTGLLMTLASAGSSGDSFANDGSRVFLVVTSANATTLTVTITPATTQVITPGFGTMTKASGGGTQTNGQTKIYGPFPSLYNDTSGRVNVTYSTSTSITVGAFRLPQP